MTGIGRDHLITMAEGVTRRADTLTGKKLKVLTDHGIQTVVFSNPNTLVPVKCVRITTSHGVIECTADTWVEIDEQTIECYRQVTRRNTTRAAHLSSSRTVLIERFVAVPVLMSCQSLISLRVGPVRILLPPV